uniref:Integrase catalytic domain-containing protein n=1 Tax=Acrobeloides nanus TaxID=290746 RepID=A0A914DSB9_9BILA
MNKTLLAVEALISKLRTECTRLENLNSAWLSLISGINDKTEKDEENQLFKKSSAKFVPVLDSAYTMSSDLETRKIELRASIDQELAPISVENQVQTSSLTRLNPAPQSPMFKLPPLVLEQFDGNILAYRGWKERMHTAFIDRPELPNDVKIMLLVFRTLNHPLICDIEKAFHAIGLDERDRKYTRFVWVRDPLKPPTKENLVVYQFRYLPFGIVCSPYLLNGTVRKHLEEINTPLALEIRNNIYADNVILDTLNEEDALEIYRQSKAIFKSAGMNMREYLSSIPGVTEKIPEEDQTKNPTNPKILGVKWDVASDTISMATPSTHLVRPKGKKAKRRYKNLPERATRRMVLAFIGAVYDPLGFMSPAILLCKLFLHKLTVEGRAWDEMLSPEEDIEWAQLAGTITNQTIHIPRLVIQPLVNDSFELHVFCDASKDAFATVIYLRQISNLKSNIVFAKSRQKPEDKTTIPRMELLGVAIGGRSLAFVKKHSRLPIKRTIAWTDSRCVLAWILAPDIAKLKVFENNRIREIRRYPVDEYRYVPTSSNPADLGTRGLPLAELNINTLWKNGPEWLNHDESQWPPKPDNQFDFREWLPTKDDPEFEVAAAVREEVENLEPLFDSSRVSTFERLLFIIAFVLRFVSAIKKRKSSGSKAVTAEEMRNAEIIAIKDSQRCHPPSKNENQNLGIRADDQGILRCYGRMERSQLEHDARSPIFICKQSRLAELIMDKIHRKSQHSAGVQQSLALLRATYWIPQATRLARKIIHNCHHCKRYRARPFKLPPMAPLPAERIKRVTPFENCGIDNFGPYIVKSNGEALKVWGCLFVCFVTRSIHIETVSELSAMAFINAFRRFVARRSKPKIVWSDNGTNFKAGSKAIMLVWRNVMVEASQNAYISTEQITWKHIPELAPFHGGAYERMVGLVKNVLRHSIGHRRLKVQDFDTLLLEAEAIVNSRPLTQMHDDLLSTEVVRPIDFLIPHALIGTPPLTNNHDDPDFLPRNAEKRELLLEVWKQTTTCLDKFWRMWHDHYLKALREHHIVSHRHPRSTNPLVPKIGELVIIQEDQAPRGCWQLGRVIELVKSSDGYTRVAKVRNSLGHVLNRAINHLYSLEVTDDARETEPPETTISTPKKQAHEAPAQRTTRSTAKIVNLTPTLAYIALLSFAGYYIGAQASECPENVHPLKWMDETKCTNPGIEIWEMPNGNYCWQQDKAAKNKIRDCRCPSWAEGCSFYKEGGATQNSKSNIPKVKQALYSLSPDACQLGPYAECDISKPSKGQLMRVTLYDNTSHYVTNFTLVWQDHWKDEYRCVGNGSIVTGSPHYCDTHACEPYGDKFCFYRQPPVAVLVVGETRIPIAAWGHVDQLQFPRRREVTTTCQSCHANCHPEGIDLAFDNGTQLITIQANGFEDRLSFPNQNQTRRLPSQVTASDYDPTIEFWMNGNKAASVSLSCKVPNSCLNLNCTWCLVESLANHRCLEKLAVAVSGIMLVITIVPSIVILCICCKIAILLLQIIRKLLHGLLWVLRKCCHRLDKQKESARVRLLDVQSDDSEDELYSRSSGRPTRIPPLITIVCYIYIGQATLQLAAACAYTEEFMATENQCFQTPEKQECRFELTTTLDILPKGQDICLFLKDPLERPVGHIKLSGVEYELVCELRNLYWTREFRLDSVSVKRCDTKGSCQGDDCDHVTLNATITELGTTANSMLGYTRCDRSCGGPSCWCGWPNPGCLFSKVFAVPINNKAYSLDTCARYVGYLSFDLSLSFNGTEVEKKRFRLSPGRNQAWKGIYLALNNLISPPQTVTQPRFLSDDTRRVYLTEQMLEKIGFLKCSTKEDALSMKCAFPPNMCMVTPGKDFALYQCPQTLALEDFLHEPTALLPQVQIYDDTSFLVVEEKGEIIMKPDDSTAQLKLTVNGLHLAVTSDLNTISATTDRVTGCYSCERGASMNVKCFTNFGTAMAHVECFTGSRFSINCNETGITQTVRIYTNQANLDEECVANTTNYSVKLTLKGELEYAPNEGTETISFTDVTGSLNLGKSGVDWLDLLRLIYSKWLHIVLFAGSAILTGLILIIGTKIACCLIAIPTPQRRIRNKRSYSSLGGSVADNREENPGNPGFSNR